MLEARERGIDIIIAGAGGAAHLPGMVASLTTLPVIGYQLKQKFKGSRFFIIYCSNARRYSGCNDCAIGAAGAKNAGILAARMLSIQKSSLVEN